MKIESCYLRPPEAITMKGTENEYAVFEVQDGILFVELRADFILNLATARGLTSARLHFQGDRVYPLFVSVDTVVESDKEGRDYLLAYGAVQTNAIAVFSRTPLSKLIARFVLRELKCSVPVALFEEKTKAIAFLKRDPA